MYSLEQVQRVQNLRDKGMTMSAIAIELKMHKSTVISMLSGDKKRKLERKSRRKGRGKSPRGVPIVDSLPYPINPNSEDTNGFAKTIVFVRCPGCGGMVQSQAPCLACFIDELLTPSSCFPASNRKV